MSKTIASAFCETNQARGLPQENIFQQDFYRTPADFGSAFIRSTASENPVQIYAVASAQGDDNRAAMALQEVMKIVSDTSRDFSGRPEFLFDTYVNQLIISTNSAVCNYSLRSPGVPIKVSLTVAVLEKDTVRIISVGNTKAVLIRRGQAIPLTENQTAANRYVQLGAITPEAERLHPESDVLTQYIGRFQEDGPVLPDTSKYLRLVDGDEISLLGTGIEKGLALNERDYILTGPMTPAQKAADLVAHARQNQIRGGLTVLHVRIESALGQQMYVPVSSYAAPSAETETELPADPNVRTTGNFFIRHKRIILPIAVLLGCVLAGYLLVFGIFNIGNLMKPGTTPATDSNGSAAVLAKVMYINTDQAALYGDASMQTAPSVYLNRGDVVTLLESGETLSKVTTTDGVTGYVLNAMLSESDPTIGESVAETGDPTPIPSQQQETSATSAAASETTSAASSETTAPSETSATESTTSATSSETSETTTAATTTTTESTTAATSETTQSTETSSTETTAG